VAVSDIGDLGILSDTLGAEGAEAYARGAIITAAVNSEVSKNQTMAMLRAAGVGFRETQVSTIYDLLSDQRAASQTASALNFDSTTGQILPGNPPENWTGQFTHEVTATFRTRSETGVYELSSRTLYLKGSTVLTPEEASQAAMGILSEPPETEGYEEMPDVTSLLTMSLTGAWYTTRGRGAWSARP
jgi:hypothetical protein